MRDINNIEPDLYDEVRNIHNEMTGTVIAIYPKIPGDEKTEKLLDVRGANDKIYYATPAKNWKVVEKWEP